MPPQGILQRRREDEHCAAASAGQLSSLSPVSSSGWATAFCRSAITSAAIPVHSIGAAICFAAALGHIYLAAGVNPDSLHGMKDGTIKASYAAHHHGAWVEELIAQGVVTREEIEEAKREDHH